jgi:AraC-like DNA-binding protein
MSHQKPAIPETQTAPPAFFVKHEFDDVDELAEVTKAWDLDFRQLNRGAFSGSVRQAVFGPIHLADTRLEGVLHQRGTTPTDVWTFCFPGHHQMEFRWRGHPVGANDLLIHQPGGEFESISKHDFGLLLVSVSGEHLEAASRRLGLSVSERALRGMEITNCAPEIVSNLRLLVKTALGILVQGHTLPRAVEQNASDLLVQGLAAGGIPDRRPPQRRQQRLIEAAIRIARERAHEIHSVKDLCGVSGASERTLRRGFNERFGISPRSYLKAQRLIGARRDLRASSQGETITDIANRWGFWHMGQFAKDYRQKFGELPSETRNNPPLGSRDGCPTNVNALDVNIGVRAPPAGWAGGNSEFRIPNSEFD